MQSIKRKIPSFIIITVLALSIILMLPGLAFAEESEGVEEVEEVIFPEELNFDITFPELNAKSGEPFEFKMDVTYIGLEEKIFDITAEQPEGWYVAVVPGYEQIEISAIKLKPGKMESLKALAIPLVKQEPGEYDIKVIVKSSVEGEDLEAIAEFKAIVTATYELSLATKTGRYSTEVTSGKDNHYKLILKNTGSASIDNITLKSTEPEGWMVEFDEDEIKTLEAGKSKEIDVTINPPEKTIAGDYMLNFSASSENSNKDIDLRVTVLTPTIWGWVGIGVIVIVIVGVAIIFARLGRR